VIGLSVDCSWIGRISKGSLVQRSFITVRMTDRWDALRARRQLKDEHSMDYFQSKVRLCRDLFLTFDEIRDHVIKGLYSKQMAMYAMSRTHRDENELLTDL